MSLSYHDPPSFKRQDVYSSEERKLLHQIIKKYDPKDQLFSNKRDVDTCHKKVQIWRAVTAQFNAHSNRSVPSNIGQIKKLARKFRDSNRRMSGGNEDSRKSSMDSENDDREVILEDLTGIEVMGGDMSNKEDHLYYMPVAAVYGDPDTFQETDCKPSVERLTASIGEDPIEIQTIDMSTLDQDMKVETKKRDSNSKTKMNLSSIDRNSKNRRRQEMYSPFDRKLLTIIMREHDPENEIFSKKRDTDTNHRKLQLWRSIAAHFNSSSQRPYPSTIRQLHKLAINIRAVKRMTEGQSGANTSTSSAADRVTMDLNDATVESRSDDPRDEIEEFMTFPSSSKPRVPIPEVTPDEDKLSTSKPTWEKEIPGEEIAEDVVQSHSKEYVKLKKGKRSQDLRLMEVALLTAKLNNEMMKKQLLLNEFETKGISPPTLLPVRVPGHLFKSDNESK